MQAYAKEQQFTRFVDCIMVTNFSSFSKEYTTLKMPYVGGGGLNLYFLFPLSILPRNLAGP